MQVYPVLGCGVGQVYCPLHIGARKNARIPQGIIVVAFRGEVNDGCLLSTARFARQIPHQLIHQIRIRNIAVCERESPRICLLQRRAIFSTQIPRVGSVRHGVQHMNAHLRPLL